jgi:Flp pilus assembly protein TadG
MQMTRFKFKNFLIAESGVAAIEFAFIFPIMVLLFFCLIDFTGYVSYNRKIAAISGAVADLVSKNRTRVNADDIQKYFSVSGMILKPLAASNVKVRVIGYRLEGTNVKKQWVVESTGSATCSADPSTASMASLMAASNDLVVAQTCMTYAPYIGSFFFNRAGHKFTNTMGPGTFLVEEVVTQRPRSSTTLDCYPEKTSTIKCTKPSS